MKKVALITGITGQDGAYLAELLLKKGYTVHGLKRRSSLFNTDRIDHLYQDPHVDDRNLVLHYGDMTDSMNLTRIIQEVQPDEIYNLAAMSHVKVSFDTPEYTANADGIGTLRILEAVRLLNLTKKTRIYQASTSELYGLVQEVPQKESTPFYPRSPYAVAKMYAYWITVNYREAYGLHASNGILFNHESPLRPERFVTQKIVRAACRIAKGAQGKLALGNTEIQRDWGWAPEYVEAMFLMLQQPKPEDYVIATGQTRKLEDFMLEHLRENGVTAFHNLEEGSADGSMQLTFRWVAPETTVGSGAGNSSIELCLLLHVKETSDGLLFGNTASIKTALGQIQRHLEVECPEVRDEIGLETRLTENSIAALEHLALELARAQ